MDLGLDALGFQVRQLFREALESDDHAGAKDVDGLGIENARRKQVELEEAKLVDHGVARIVAALKTYDKIRVLGEVIHHAPLALVAPIGAHDNFYAHLAASMALAGISVIVPGSGQT
jgi:hypothetical protein